MLWEYLIGAVQATSGISVVGSVTANAGSGATSISVDLTGISMHEDDVVLMMIGFNPGGANNRVLTPPSGYTNLADMFNNSTESVNFGAAWKQQTATLDTTITYTISTGAGADTRALAIVYRGASGFGTPALNSATDGQIDPPSVAGAVTGDWVVAMGAQAVIAGQVNALGVPSGFTGMLESNSSVTNAELVMGACYNETPADPEDPGAFSGGWASVGGAQCSMSVVLLAA